MANELELGIILLPDDKTITEAQRLFNKTLETFSEVELLDRNSYEGSYPNQFHVSLFQLRVSEENLSSLCQAIEKIGAVCPSLAFEMDHELVDTQENIFWNSQEAKNIDDLKKLHETVIQAANHYRDPSEFSQIAAMSEKEKAELNEKQKESIKAYGIFWGLTHNFNPHITLIYNSGKDREGIKISEYIREIKPNRTIFKASTLAIGELGPAGNVINILHSIKLGESYAPAEKFSPRLTPT